ncbi:MAG: VOC family protein [Acidimicrobiales bacterium]
MARTVTITFDAADPARLAEFWALALRYELEPPPPGYESWEHFADEKGIPPENRNDGSAVVDPDGNGPRLLFLKVPEGKTAKNRMHLDVLVAPKPDGPKSREHMAVVQALADELVAAGGTEVGPCSDFGSTWIVMSDPEGNEFCVI